MQEECISAVLWPNLINNAPNIHLNAFNSFYRAVIHKESLGIFTSPIQTMFPNILLQKSFFLLSPQHFFIRTLLLSFGEPKGIQDFNTFWIASTYVIFPLQREYLPFFTTPKLPPPIVHVVLIGLFLSLLKLNLQLNKIVLKEFLL